MTISVSQLNNYIHGIIDIDGILNNVSVCGEITNLKCARDGYYFSLKDDDASVNCFCYLRAGEPQAGNVVIAEGQINYFVKYGTVSLFVRRFTSTQNTGSAYLRYVALKEQLRKEGLFDESKKRAVPHCCSKIGVITSETGAVIHDITTVAFRRQPFVDIILYPVKVQGVGADLEMVEGIQYFNNSDVDAVIIGRGGGSNEDLSVFNAENLVRAVACSLKPIVSAVGHGIDFTLCDFAADLRAVTPSEAAEYVTLDVGILKGKLLSSLQKIDSALQSTLQNRLDRVKYCANFICLQTANDIDKVAKGIVRTVNNCNLQLSNILQESNLRVSNAVDRLSSLNPANILKRGYAYICNRDGVVVSVEQAEIDSVVSLTLADGKLQAKIIAKEKK